MKRKGKKTPKNVTEKLLAKSREKDAAQQRQYWKDKEKGINGIIRGTNGI